MNLTQAQKDAIREKIRIPDRCPCCGHLRFEFSGELVEVREYYEGHNMLAAGAAPLVQVICQNCSMALFFSALRLGIVGRDGKVNVGKSDRGLLGEEP